MAHLIPLADLNVYQFKIRQAANHVDEAKVRLDMAVEAARDAGQTWGAIGDAFGVSRQSAWERFHHLPALTKEADEGTP